MGATGPTYRRKWYAHLSSQVSDILELETVAQFCPIFSGLMGRRVRFLRCVGAGLRWDTRHKVSWRQPKRRVAADDEAARDCDTAFPSSDV